MVSESGGESDDGEQVAAVLNRLLCNCQHGQLTEEQTSEFEALCERTRASVDPHNLTGYTTDQKFTQRFADLINKRISGGYYNIIVALTLPLSAARSIMDETPKTFPGLQLCYMKRIGKFFNMPTILKGTKVILYPEDLAYFAWIARNRIRNANMRQFVDHTFNPNITRWTRELQGVIGEGAAALVFYGRYHGIIDTSENPYAVHVGSLDPHDLPGYGGRIDVKACREEIPNAWIPENATPPFHYVYVEKDKIHNQPKYIVLMTILNCPDRDNLPKSAPVTVRFEGSILATEFFEIAKKTFKQFDATYKVLSNMLHDYVTD